VILVDANILMYAAGADHPNREPSVDLLKRIGVDEVAGVLDAEVLQEVLHRYRAIGRWVEGRQVYDAARTLFPVVLPIATETLDVARGLLDDHVKLSARDALHAATVLVHGLDAICSFDRGFDAIPSVRRLEPAAIR